MYIEAGTAFFLPLVQVALKHVLLAYPTCFFHRKQEEGTPETLLSFHRVARAALGGGGKDEGSDRDSSADARIYHLGVAHTVHCICRGSFQLPLEGSMQTTTRTPDEPRLGGGEQMMRVCMSGFFIRVSVSVYVSQLISLSFHSTLFSSLVPSSPLF